MTDREGNPRDLPRPPALANTRATVVARQDHPISRKAISNGAMKVLYRLLGAGHQAFLVGGGVRDLLLGGEPKDSMSPPMRRPRWYAISLAMPS